MCCCYCLLLMIVVLLLSTTLGQTQSEEVSFSSRVLDQVNPSCKISTMWYKTSCHQLSPPVPYSVQVQYLLCTSIMLDHSQVAVLISLYYSVHRLPSIPTFHVFKINTNL